MKNSTYNTVYEKGWSAYEQGRSIDSCPYVKGEFIDIWQQGWLDAQATLKFTG